MKVNFQRTIAGLDGAEIKDDMGALTLGRVAAQALNVPSEDRALECGMLALKVYAAQQIEITPEEAALIREALPKAWVPVVVAQAHQMLEG